MDLTSAIQALRAYHLANDYKTMKPAVQLLPKEIDDEVARVKSNAAGMGWTA